MAAHSLPNWSSHPPSHLSLFLGHSHCSSHLHTNLNSITHPPIHRLTRSPKHNNIHPSMSSPTYPITHSTPPHTHCLTYPLIHLATLIYQLKLICSPTHYYNKSPANSNIHSPIHSHTRSPINIIDDSTYPHIQSVNSLAHLFSHALVHYHLYSFTSYTLTPK